MTVTITKQYAVVIPPYLGNTNHSVKGKMPMRLAIRDDLDRQSRPGHQRKRDAITFVNETQDRELRGIQKDNK